MPEYGKNSGRDLTDNLLRRLDALESEVKTLRGTGRRSAMDRGDTAAMPSPVEGQTMIQYDTGTPKYYQSAAWHDFGGTGGSNVQSLQLWSSNGINGDASYDLSAYSGGVGGAINGIEYRHAVKPTDTSWYGLQYLGSAAVAPPYDAITLTGVGQYSISAWTHLLDGGADPTFTQADAWFKHQIIAIAGHTGFTTYTPQFYADAKLVYGTGVGSPPMAHDGSNGGFYAVANCYVETGHTGQAYVSISHQDNHVVTIYPEQFLQVIYYGSASLGTVE